MLFSSMQTRRAVLSKNDGSRKVGRTFRSQQADQGFVHIIVVVGYSEDGDFFPAQSIFEATVEPGFVDGFHHKNDIRPFDLIGGKGDFRVVGKTCGIRLHARVVAENRFRRGATELVTRAEKEDMPHIKGMIAATAELSQARPSQPAHQSRKSCHWVWRNCFWLGLSLSEP